MDGPPAENRMMGPSASVGVAPPEQGPPMAGPPMAGPQGPAPGAPAAPPPSPKQLRQFIEHADPVIKGLIELLNEPKGSLTKQKVADGAADIIAKGGFPTPEQKQALIVDLARVKNDDPDIRNDLTTMLTKLLDMRAQLVGLLRKGTG